MSCISNWITKPSYVVLAGIFVLTGCASSAKHQDQFLELQKAFDAVRQSPTIAYNAPVQMGEAEQAFAAVTQGAKEGIEDELLEHRIYIAAKRLEIAKRVASAKLADQRYQALARDREDLIFALNDRDLARERKARDVAQRNAQRLQEALSEFQVERTARGLMVTLGEVVFETNKSDLKPGIARRLTPLVDFLRTTLDRTVEIEGHTDSVGETEYNVQLSQKRAETVRAFLLSGGIAPERVSAKGLGEVLPIASNDTADGRQRNRRVEIIIKEVK